MTTTVPNHAPLLISPKEAASLIGSEKVRFVDVRQPEVYSEGHIEGASNMFDLFTYLATSDEHGKQHLMNSFEDIIRSKGINGDERIITYEGSLNTLFGASCRGWYLFNLLGHSNVQVLDGGLAAWQKEGLPLVAGEEQTYTTEGTFTATWSPDLWADRSDVQSIIQGEATGIKLLDVRDPVEWNAVSSSPYGVDFAPRKGRLDGAVHLPWYTFMQEDTPTVATFKDNEEIRDMMSKEGINVNDTIIVYCFKGARAANTLIALKKAGFNNVRNYFASWNEWSRHENLKIDGSVR